ncbi:MAG: efflux RND transporter periplasmic adaptor subunit [Chloroflexi bacterium]|nr:efflux RND transporter periplasmic adaptor subunit [Chloroflexota bacterium]
MEKNNSSSPKRKSRISTKAVAITAVVVLLVAAGAYFAWPAAEPVAEMPALQTTKVRTGDLTITASGAGTVLPAAQMDLAFHTGGMLTELNVAVGDVVQRGEVLARLEESVQAEADFQALFSAQGLTQAELAVATAESALEDAILDLKYLLGPDAYYWETQLKQAEETLAALNADPNASAEQKTEAQNAVEKARLKRDYFLELYLRTLARDHVFVTEADIALGRANLESAKVALQDAQDALEIVKAGPEALTAPITALGAETAALEQARLAAENTRLVAPFGGSVIALNVVKGQTVGTSPVMTIATTDQLLVRFYLDETDVDKAAAGMQVNFTFDAYPDAIVTGEIVLVEPALQIVDGTPVVVVWAKLPEDAPFTILSGMTVEAEVIAGEAKNALIVPVQALRELTPGSYAVFLVQSDGSLKMTPVTIGLRDFANAEILSGLKVGDVVSTGTVETK